MVVFEKDYSENENEDNMRGVKDWNLLISALEEPEDDKLFELFQKTPKFLEEQWNLIFKKKLERFN